MAERVEGFGMGWLPDYPDFRDHGRGRPGTDKTETCARTRVRSAPALRTPGSGCRILRTVGLRPISGRVAAVRLQGHAQPHATLDRFCGQPCRRLYCPEFPEDYYLY